jgi:hypothetical protein
MKKKEDSRMLSRDYESAHNLNKEDKEVKKALETLKNHL